jgi:predicted ribosome quality control (RQC) complex YloA/Tae2 family protein
VGLSAGHVGELVRELTPLVERAEVREVLALPPRDLVLVLAPEDAARAPVLRLRLSADPEHARLHLQIAPVKRHEGPSDPFFARVRDALAGCTLHALAQTRADRVVRLAFRRDGQPAAELVGELTGRHANLVLLDGAGRVLARLVEPPARSAERLAPRAAYAPPPPPQRPGDARPAEPALAERFPPATDAGPSARLAPLSARVEAALGTLSDARFAEEARRELERRLERRRVSARGLVQGLEQRAAAAAAAERVRMDADLLLAHLASVPRGAREVEVPDSFTDGSPPRRIALDPGIAPRRNAEKLFARYKKLVRTLARLPEELRIARENAAALEALLARLPAADPGALEAEAVAAGLLQPAQEAPRAGKPVRPEPRLPYLRFRGLRGSEIRVGRNARDNDQLTFRAARGNDLWLHTADSPGSHVVLPLAKGAEPDPEELLDAAHLAVHFSPRRGAPRADVHVARRKEVHKPRKAPAGLVTLSGGKTMRLRVEPARLERLLSARHGASGGPA